MVDTITFLSNLNRTLKQIEQEIIQRVIVCLEIAEGKLKAENTFTTGYEVEATVEYFSLKDEPAHSYAHTFYYKGVIIEKDYGLLMDYDTDWRESYMPELDEIYCYLLHDLIDHSQPRLRENIIYLETIWVDIIYKDQKGIKINDDGSSRMLVWNEEERGFE